MKIKTRYTGEEKRIIQFVEQIQKLGVMEIYGACAIMGIEDADKDDGETLVNRMIDLYISMPTQRQKNLNKILKDANRYAK